MAVTPDTISQAAQEAREALERLLYESADGPNYRASRSAITQGTIALASLEAALASEGEELVASAAAELFCRNYLIERSEALGHEVDSGELDESAKDLFEGFCKYVDYRSPRTPPAKEPEAASRLSSDAQAEVAKAVAAEREACAKVASAWRDIEPANLSAVAAHFGITEDDTLIACATADGISAAIRNRTDGERP